MRYRAAGLSWCSWRFLDNGRPAEPNMPENVSQKQSSAYRLAELDPDFLLGESMRGIRFFLEFAKAEERLRSWGIRSTIVVFGSARPHAGERRKVPTHAAKGPAE